jgi:hypothetical protein
VKLPADWNVLLNPWPGLMMPEFHSPLSEVDVCAMVSLLVHVTVVPTLTVIGLGLYAVVVIDCAPATIDTPDPEGDGEGEGVGVGVGDDGDDEPLLQAAAPPARVTRRRNTVLRIKVDLLIKLVVLLVAIAKRLPSRNGNLRSDLSRERWEDLRTRKRLTSEVKRRCGRPEGRPPVKTCYVADGTGDSRRYLAR